MLSLFLPYSQKFLFRNKLESIKRLISFFETITMNAIDFKESTHSVKNSHTMSFNERKLSPARNLLLNRIFLGCYEERRYVVQLKEYRDVVKISSAESELKTDLDAVNKDLKEVCGIKWLGITVPEAQYSKPGYSLWVKLTNIPFGSFWFQIKQINYEHEEVILRLKCLRSLRPEDYAVAVKDITPKLEDSKNSGDPSEYSFDFDLGRKITMLCATMSDTIARVGPSLTWDNFVLGTKFIFAMAFVFISASLTMIGYIGDYFLRLVRELILLLNVLTPVFVEVINCFTKIIGGVFILIALMIRDRGAQQLQNQFQAKCISYPQQKLQLMPSHPVQGPDSPVNSPVTVQSNWRKRNDRCIK